VLVSLESREAIGVSGTDLVVLRSDAGDAVPARLIGAVSGRVPVDAPWRIESAWRIDESGVPLISIAPDASPTGTGSAGHDWGALGLPEGMSTRVRLVHEHTQGDEVRLAHESHGHRLGENTWWLTLAPGDLVTLDGRPATVLATDRRRRAVEIDTGDEVQTVALDDLTPQETTT
jgi:hypothetical protein